MPSTVPRILRVPPLCWTPAQAEKDFGKALDDLDIKWKNGPHNSEGLGELGKEGSEEVQRAEEYVKKMCGETRAKNATSKMDWSTRVDTYIKEWGKDVDQTDAEKLDTRKDEQPGAGDEQKPNTVDDKKDPDEVRRSWK